MKRVWVTCWYHKWLSVTFLHIFMTLFYIFEEYFFIERITDGSNNFMNSFAYCVSMIFFFSWMLFAYQVLAVFIFYHNLLSFSLSFMCVSAIDIQKWILFSLIFLSLFDEWVSGWVRMKEHKSMLIAFRNDEDCCRFQWA